MLGRVPALTILSLALACACQAQQTTSQGQTLKGNTSGALVPGSPFACNVDGNVFAHIADCVNFLTTSGRLGGVITSNTPEHITSASGLPWNPATFSGVLRLGNGSSSSSGCSTTVANCWLTDVPIILGSGMRIVGSGKVPTTTGGVSTNGTGIGPSSTFPSPLGQPSMPTLTCLSGTMPAATYLVEVVEVNQLDTYSGTGTAESVPGFSQASMEAMSSSCGAGNSLQVSFPATLTSSNPSFNAVECRVFVTTTALGSGNEMLQVPGPDMSCSAGTGTVDPSACKLGSGTQTATVTTLQTGGDPPNLIDLSNPLVADIGGGGSSPGFWAVLQNLTLALPGSAGTNNPNVAFWNPTDQENSGLSFVSFTGETINSTAPEPGAWIYIGNHAPNSFISNVQTDTNPTSGTFYGMILDGRPGSGTVGTARVVYNSTFTPARVGGSMAVINAAALVTGAVASVDFIDDHFEVNGSMVTGTKDCIQVTNSANVSAQGPTQFCNPFIHLTSTGNDIGVRNVTTTPGTSAVVQDDFNNVTLKGHVSDYSTAKNTPVMTVTTLSTATNCAAVGSSASPSVAMCGSAAAGAFSCATNASGATCAVDTTAVDASSEIFVVQVESEGSRLTVTCYTGSAVRTSAPLLFSKSAGVGFAINLGTVTTNPACFDYLVVN